MKRLTDLKKDQVEGLGLGYCKRRGALLFEAARLSDNSVVEVAVGIRPVSITLEPHHFTSLPASVCLLKQY